MITLMKLERSLSSKQLVRSHAAASCPTQPCRRALRHPSHEWPCHQERLGMASMPRDGVPPLRKGSMLQGSCPAALLLQDLKAKPQSWIPCPLLCAQVSRGHESTLSN